LSIYELTLKILSVRKVYLAKAFRLISCQLSNISEVLGGLFHGNLIAGLAEPGLFIFERFYINN
jgi:hypothetical protein